MQLLPLNKVILSVICKLPCVMKRAESDMDNKPHPTHSVTQALNIVAYKSVKYNFQERKNASLCVSSFYLSRVKKDLCIFVCPI